MRRNVFLDMNIKNAAATIAALTLLAGAPAIARAAATDSGNPIVVSNVYFDSANNFKGTGPGSVSFNFRNTSQTAATDVVFVLDAAGTQVDQFDDRGTFAPGVAIRPTFPTAAEASDVQVKVAQVTFADGSVWVPDAAPLPYR